MPSSPDSPSVTGDSASGLAFDLVSDFENGGGESSMFEALCRFVLREEGRDASGPWEVTLALVDDPALRELHARFMGLDSVTDVMTFPLEEDGVNGGDIVVSVERAAAQGPDHGHTAEEEVRFLFVHGLLHLCGWDDATAALRGAMLTRQTTLLHAFDAASKLGT